VAAITQEDPTSATLTKDEQADGHGWSWVAKALDLIRRYWATASLIVAIVRVAGLATGALWRGVEAGDSLYDSVAYGLPARAGC